MRTRIVSFKDAGLVLRPLAGAVFTIAYGEILTAERGRGGRRIVLHTKTHDRVRLRLRGAALLEAELRLRENGVRIVDCWGAIITPTLADFEEELAHGPDPVRQSSDNA
jgi:hypothetical protein